MRLNNTYKKNLLTAFGVVFFVVAIIAGFLLMEKYRQGFSNLPYYEDLDIEDMHLDNKTGSYALRNGMVYHDGKQLIHWYQWYERSRVLKLALFYQWLKEDPLFFDPNLDIDSFNQAAARMKDVNELWNHKTSLGYVQPADFLQSFSESSKQYQKLNQNISEENAHRMLLKLYESQKIYAKDAEVTGKFFEDMIVQGNDKNSMLFLGGDTTSNVSIMEDDFKKIKSNSIILRQEIEQREGCLNKMQCQRPLLSFSKPIFGELNNVENLPEILPDDEIKFGDDIRKESGPFLIHSLCWKERSVNLLYQAKKCLPHQTFCFDWSFLSDGDYWVKTFPEISKEKKMLEKNVERRIQSATAPYGCTNLTYKPQIATIAFAIEEYKNEKLFDSDVPASQDIQLNQELSKIWEEGKQIEQSFFDAKYPSDTNLDILANYYKYAYGFFAKHKLLSETKREKFLQRVNFLNGKMSDFSMILDRSTYFFAYHLEQDFNMYKSVKDPEYYFVYDVLAIRNNYSITFLNFSPFVWRLNEAPKYLIPTMDKRLRANQKSPSDNPVIDQQDAIELFGKEKLKEWGNLTYQIRADGH